MTPLQIIENLLPDQISVVASVRGDVGRSEVREGAGYRWLVSCGQSVQTLMTVESPAALLLPNHVAMLFALLLIDEVDSVLSLGMGGGSLERFLHKQYPHCSISSVEPNNDIIRFAQEFFGVPESVQIIPSKAEDFIQTSEQRYNLIFCDIFDRERHPACLFNNSFYQDIKSILHPEGVLALNVTPQSDVEMLDILQALRGSFSVVYIAAIDNRGNAIIVTMNSKIQSIDVIRSRAEILSTSAEVSLTQWVEKFRLIPAPTAS